MVQLLGRDVGNTGYGLMGLTWRANAAPDEQAFEAMKAAIATGATFWNGGEFYGDMEKGPNSLTLLNKYFTKYPEDKEKVVISIKGGMRADFSIDGTPEGVQKSVNNCLRLLPPSVKKIDIFECARVDPKTPIETTIGALAQLVKEGKIGGIGLSEVKAETIRRAAKVHQIASVEVELSLWETTFLQNGVVEACAEHNIPLVAYSPLGRGFLTGEIKSRADIPAGDFRLGAPRFSEENFPKNLDLVEKLKKFADQKGCTPAQLALAWVRSMNARPGYPSVIPIPGATKASRVEENGKTVQLTKEELNEIDDIMKSITISGLRYPEHAMSTLEG